ncbi:MAG TPA: MFS transporter [Pseudonocardiaceae bacterium]
MASETDRPATIRATLGVGEFRAIWLAEFQSVLGDQLARVALSVLVFARTGSAVWPALTYSLTYLPDLFGGTFLSGWADRFPRKAVMVVADAARAVLLGAMALPGVPLPLVAVLLVVAQLFNSPFNAAQAATLPVALDGENYVLGQSLRQATNQAGQLVGFAVGGLIIALIGPSSGLAVDAVSFGISAVVIGIGVRSRPAPKVEATEAGTAMRRLAAGARIIWRDDRMRTLVTLAWLAGFVIVPEGLAVPYAAELGGGATTAGLLLAAHPAGIVIGALFFGRFVRPTVRAKLLGALAIGAIVPLLGYAWHPPLAITIGLLLLSGFCASYQVTASATFMRLVPDESRGQAFGLAGSGLIAVQGIGLVVGGLMVLWLHSAGRTVAVIAAAGLLVALPAAVAWRRARQADPLS